MLNIFTNIESTQCILVTKDEIALITNESKYIITCIHGHKIHTLEQNVLALRTSNCSFFHITSTIKIQLPEFTLCMLALIY
jgi:hypothetical protein